MSNSNVNIIVSGPKKDYTSAYKTYILRSNINFADQVTKPNMKYIIKYDFDLGSAEVTIPENCVLEFDGGSLNNGTLIWNNTIIYGNFFEHVFNIKFGSNFFAPDILYINVDMFGADPTGQIDSIEAINNAIEYVSRNKLNIPIYFTNNGVYYITDNIICRDYTTLIGNGSTFKYKWVYGIDEEYKSCTIISNYRIDATNNIRIIGGNTHISIKGFNFNIVNSLNYFNVEGLRIPNGAITFYDVDYLEISEIYYTFKNNVQPIWTEGCSHIDIHDCTLIKEIKDGDTEDLNATVSSGIWIMNNNIRDVSDIRIHNNYIVGRRDECIAVQSINHHTRNVYIYDNTLYNNYVMNISITPGYKEVNSIEPIMHNINIYNNRLYGGFVSLRKGQEDIKIYNNYFSNKDIYARTYAGRLAFVLIDSTTNQNSINSTLNRINIFDNFIEIGQEETDSIKLYVVYIIALTTNINIYNNIIISTSSALFSQCIHSDGASRISLCNNDIRVRFTYLLYSQNNASNLIIKGNIVEALSCIMYINLRNNIVAQNLNIVDNKINNVIGPFNFVLSNKDSGFSLTYNDICFISGNVIRSGAQIKSPAKSLGNLMSVNQSAIVTNSPNYISRENIGTIQVSDVYDGKVIILSGSEIPTSLSYYYAGKYKSFDGCLYDTRRSGMLGQRPIGTSIYVGFVYFDTSLTPKRPIWASEINGDTVTWVDATGAIV